MKRFLPRIGHAWRLLICVALVGSVLVVHNQPGAHAATGDWSTYLHDPLRTSAVDAGALAPSQTAAMTRLWQFTTDGPIAAAPAISGATAFAGSQDGFEYAIDVQTGAQLWRSYLGQTDGEKCLPAGKGISSTPTVENGVVYATGAAPYLYALDAMTGDVLWRTFVGASGSASEDIYGWSSPLIYKGSAYVALAGPCSIPSVQGRLMRIDLNTHAVSAIFEVGNSAQAGGEIRTSPSVDPNTDTIYVTTGAGGSQGGSIIALDAASLKVKDSWKAPASGAGTPLGWATTPLLFDDGAGQAMMAATHGDGLLYAFNRGNLAAGPAWQAQVAPAADDLAPRPDAAAAFGQGRLYVAGGPTTISGDTYQGSVKALDTNGRTIWEHGTRGAVQSPLAYANGLVLVSSGHSLEVLDSATGAVAHSSTADNVTYGPAAVSNGRIFAGSSNGYFQAFVAEAPPVAATATPIPVATAAKQPDLSLALALSHTPNGNQPAGTAITFNAVLSNGGSKLPGDAVLYFGFDGPAAAGLSGAEHVVTSTGTARQGGDVSLQGHHITGLVGWVIPAGFQGNAKLSVTVTPSEQGLLAFGSNMPGAAVDSLSVTPAPSGPLSAAVAGATIAGSGGLKVVLGHTPPGDQPAGTPVLFYAVLTSDTPTTGTADLNFAFGGPGAAGLAATEKAAATTGAVNQMGDVPLNGSTYYGVVHWSLPAGFTGPATLLMYAVPVTEGPLALGSNLPGSPVDTLNIGPALTPTPTPTLNQTETPLATETPTPTPGPVLALALTHLPAGDQPIGTKLTFVALLSFSSGSLPAQGDLYLGFAGPAAAGIAQGEQAIASVGSVGPIADTANSGAQGLLHWVIPAGTSGSAAVAVQVVPSAPGKLTFASSANVAPDTLTVLDGTATPTPTATLGTPTATPTGGTPTPTPTPTNGTQTATATPESPTETPTLEGGTATATATPRRSPPTATATSSAASQSATPSATATASAAAGSLATQIASNGGSVPTILAQAASLGLLPTGTPSPTTGSNQGTAPSPPPPSATPTKVMYRPATDPPTATPIPSRPSVSPSSSSAPAPSNNVNALATHVGQQVNAMATTIAGLAGR